MKSALTTCNTNWKCYQNHHRTSFSVTNTINYRTRCSISMANPIKTYHLSNLTQTELLSLKSRPRIDFSSVFDIVTFFLSLFLKWVFLFHSQNLTFLLFQVNPIVDDVHAHGDAAVKQFSSLLLLIPYLFIYLIFDLD